MSENQNNQTQRQFSEIMAFSVDDQEEEKLISQILAYTLSQELAQSPLLPVEDNDRDKSYVALDKVVEEFFLTQSSSSRKDLSKFAKIQFAITLTEKVFSQLIGSIKLPYLLAKLILQIKLPFFRLMLSSPEIILNHNNPATHLISKLTSYCTIWKDESKIGYPTFSKLSQLLSFENTPNHLLLKQFNNALSPITEIKQNQQKRSLIFEKRLKETEDTLAKNSICQQIVDRIFQQLNSNFQLEQKISERLNDDWRQLLQLEYVRDEEQAFFESVNTLSTLLLSLEPVDSSEMLNWLMDTIPSLNERLNKGFIKLSLSDIDTNEFFASLEALHIQMIAKANQEFSASQTSSDDGTREAILRLDPSDVFNQPGEQLERSEAVISNEAAKEELPNPSKKINRIETILFGGKYENSISELTQNLVIDDALTLKKDSQTLNQMFSLVVDCWYYFEKNSTFNKLLYVNNVTGEHVFSGQDAKKSYSLSVKELLSNLSEKKIIKVQFDKIIVEAADLAIAGVFSKFSQLILDQKTNAKLTKTNTKEIKKTISSEPATEQNVSLSNNKISDHPIKRKSNSAIPKSISPKAQQSKEKVAEVKKFAVFKIETLTVGSWFKIKRDEQFVKCKLAAKIASKNSFIFVNRKGQKLFEFYDTDLVNLFQKGHLKLVDIEVSSESMLASVITKTRTLKSDQ